MSDKNSYMGLLTLHFDFNFSIIEIIKKKVILEF